MGSLRKRAEACDLRSEGRGSSFYRECGSVMMPSGTLVGPALCQLTLLNVVVARDGQFYHSMQI
ncbi:MAG: hypothetical protein ACJAU9_001145 [Lentimonas sp.]|jgi:hypothetical protein